MATEREAIPLEEHETASLLKAQQPGDPPLALYFGPGWASLKYWQCPWTLPILARLRKIESLEPSDWIGDGI
jgi:hypothetical protein